MLKPIAVIYLPRNICSGSKEIFPFELANGLNGDNSQYDMPRELYGDYLWWVFPTDSNEFKLEVFHPKDFNDMQYLELKNLLEQEIKKINHDRL